jgi:hypothetical protein
MANSLDNGVAGIGSDGGATPLCRTIASRLASLQARRVAKALRQQNEHGDEIASCDHADRRTDMDESGGRMPFECCSIDMGSATADTF